jgi:hypothetical protein
MPFQDNSAFTTLDLPAPVDVSIYSNNAIRKPGGRFYMRREADAKFAELNARIAALEQQLEGSDGN